MVGLRPGVLVGGAVDVLVCTYYPAPHYGFVYRIFVVFKSYNFIYISIIKDDLLYHPILIIPGPKGSQLSQFILVNHINMWCMRGTGRNDKPERSIYTRIITLLKNSETDVVIHIMVFNRVFGTSDSLTQRATQDDGGQLYKIRCRLDTAVTCMYVYLNKDLINL